MYELYDREFDLEDTLEVIECLKILRRTNRIKNKRIQIFGKDSNSVEFWRGVVNRSYNDCEAILKKYNLNYDPYKIIRTT